MAGDIDIERYMQRSIGLEQFYEALADNAGLGADEINKPEAGKAFFFRIWAFQKNAVYGNGVVQAYIRDPNT